MILSDGGTEADVIDQLNLQAQLLWSSGTEGSQDRALEALRCAERASYDRGAMHARRQLARLATETGDFEEAARHLSEATRLAELSAEDMEVGSCAFAAGYTAYRLGDFTRATSYLQQAIDRFDGLGALNSVARSMSYLSAVHVAAGDLDAAEEIAEEAMRIARSCRALNVVAETASDLAEIARFRGQWSLARERYLEARRWMDLAGSQNALLVRFNLALVRVGEGDWENAQVEFSALVNELSSAGWTSRVVPARAGQAICYLAGRQIAEFDQVFERLESAVGEQADRDLAWLLERGAEIAAEDEPRQARLVAAARAQYERLGDAESAKRVSALTSR